MSFECFKLDNRVARGLQAAGYQEATPIQAACIPAILKGLDLIGTAQTGTGKTAAFVLPILHKLLTDSKTGKGRTRALVVTPTRELAEQIYGVVRELGKFTSLKAATVYGGVGMLPQEKALKQGVEIIIGCPGRLLDHMNRGNAKFDQVEVLVLDEADLMLDMGFLPSIQKILKDVSQKRQTLLFSATFDSSLERLAASASRSPKRFSMGNDAPAATVSHALYPVPQHLKPGLLQKLLEGMDSKSVLVFTRTKHRADRIADKIKRAGFSAAALHSNKSQGQRKQAMDHFRAGKINVLVATDIAARGLDIAGISHVINFDIPDTATTYIHRIGRTGRAEHTGDAFTLVTSEDRDTIRDIERLLGTQVERRMLDGFDYKDLSVKDSMPSLCRGGSRGRSLADMPRHLPIEQKPHSRRRAA
ncbi:MAG: DEAD/DEAH box helicase [Smithellaceae bacterium]|nr:DEAD/DEAH box helicase [Smithellaceae bacterium]